MPQTWKSARRRTAVCEFSNCQAATEGSRHFNRGSRENSFNNMGLITGATGEDVTPENLGVAERGDTGQGGRAFVTSRGGIFYAIGAEGPEAIGADSGAAELIVGMVEVAHADLTETPRMVVVMEHMAVAHVFGTTAASGVISVLLEIGHRRR